MSNQNQSISAPSSPSSPSSPPSPSPLAPPGWSELSGFRETCLLHLGSEDARAFRAAGVALHRLALEGPDPWPGPESALVLQTRAVLADLAYLQGYLAMMGDEAHTADLPPAEQELARAAERIAHYLGDLTRGLEAALT